MESLIALDDDINFDIKCGQSISVKMILLQMCNFFTCSFWAILMTFFCEIIYARLAREDYLFSLPRVYYESADGHFGENYLPNKFRKKDYYALESENLEDVHRNGLDYEIDGERRPDLEATGEEITPYKYKKYAEQYEHQLPIYHHHSYHPQEIHHHTPHHPPIRHSSHVNSKHLYLPIPIQQPTGTKKHDLSVWIWPLIFIIILPLVLGAILLPLALVFLMNLIFLLFTMRNNTPIGVVPGGGFNAKSSSKTGKLSQNSNVIHHLVKILEKSHQKYESVNKSKLL